MNFRIVEAELLEVTAKCVSVLVSAYKKLSWRSAYTPYYVSQHDQTGMTKQYRSYQRPLC
jgi:hypothetical protein